MVQAECKGSYAYSAEAKPISNDKTKFDMKKKTKLNIELALAVVMTVFGIALTAAAFWVPPTGVIDPTVLTAYGETLTFVGALVGVDYHYKFKNSRGDEPAENTKEENGKEA